MYSVMASTCVTHIESVRIALHVLCELTHLSLFHVNSILQIRDAVGMQSAALKQGQIVYTTK